MSESSVIVNLINSNTFARDRGIWSIQHLQNYDTFDKSHRKAQILPNSPSFINCNFNIVHKNVLQLLIHFLTLVFLNEY